jgi:hypothetical protein
VKRFCPHCIAANESKVTHRWGLHGSFLGRFC